MRAFDGCVSAGQAFTPDTDKDVGRPSQRATVPGDHNLAFARPVRDPRPIRMRSSLTGEWMRCRGGLRFLSPPLHGLRAAPLVERWDVDRSRLERPNARPRPGPLRSGSLAGGDAGATTGARRPGPAQSNGMEEAVPEQEPVGRRTGDYYGQGGEEEAVFDRGQAGSAATPEGGQ